MPLILAIVADPHEAAQLAALIQGRLAVDLVQAAEVGEGLLALEDRIPDLILTSPLMSPFDDGVLDEYLRDLGPAGTHVQTLRIPVLNHAPKKTTRLGFSLRRRPKPEAPMINGCEPKVFADEIEQYLARAAEEKRHAASSDAPVRVERQAAPEPAVAEEQWTAAYSDDAPQASAAWAAAEPEAEPGGWRADLLDRPPVEETPVYHPTAAAYQESQIDDEEAAPEVNPVHDEPSPLQEEPAPSYDEPTAMYSRESATEADAAWHRDVVIQHVPVDEPVVAEPSSLTSVEAVTEMTADEIVEPEYSIDTGEATRAIEAVPAIEAPLSIETAAPIETTPTIEPVPAMALVNEAAEPEIAASAASEPASAPRTENPPIERVGHEPMPVGGPQRAPSSRDGNGDSLKATPSFKAALAAIRAAWGKSPREASPAVPPASPAPVKAEPVVEESSFEVDLTGAVEVLEEPPADVDARVAAPAQRTDVDPVAETADVYELSVEPDLSELESTLITPIAPRRERPTAEPAVTPSAIDEENAGESDPAAADAEGDKRKKGKRPAKAVKAKPARQGQAQPQAPQNEWGIFDPNQCGFAALVDKLDEVADEKAEQRRNGAKARVISLS